MTTRDDFEHLVDKHARLMSSAIRKVCGRRHRILIPDVEQEVRLALWKRLGTGKEIVFPTSYLYKMALTTALALVRKYEGPVPMVPLDSAPEAAVAAKAERRRLLVEVLAGLGADEKRALEAYLAGFNHREIAQLHGWSESAARHRIYRTIDRLKRAQSRLGEKQDAS